MVDYHTKRVDQETVEDVQAGNRDWWTSHTMSYDWTDRIGHEQFSAEWYDEMDERFIYASRLFATETQPFDKLIPFEQLRGKRVLEVGCGMGLHTELMVRAGAEVTAIDLSPVSVESTRRRLEIRGLQATVLESDAEKLPFADGSFDFVWSWGVIHHSSRTGRAAREIARVLKPDGECRIMVYNRGGLSTVVGVLRDQVFRLGLGRRSIEESLYRSTDGFSARFYVREQFEDLFRSFFRDVSSELCGSDVDAVPLPSRLRTAVCRVLPDSYLRYAVSRWGGFLFLTAKNPD